MPNKSTHFWLRPFLSWRFDESITEASLTAEFAGMSDERLRRVDPSQLTALAHPLWCREMARRGLQPRKGA